MSVRLAAGSIALALLLASPGRAQDDDHARSGPYAGLGYSQGFEFFYDLGSADSSFGFTAVAGWRVTPFWSAELDLEYMNGFDLASSGGASLRTLSATLDFVLYALDGRIQPYIKFGGGFGRTEVTGGPGASDSSVGGLLNVGVGGDYYLTRSIVLNLESMYIGSLGDIDGTSHLNATLGARYRF